MVELQRKALSPDDPWPGLDPFDEADRDYFYGRQTESGDLIRLVRREPLTVLFGRSGLGKTSLLKAGLFPLLRGDDFLPVYLRLNHAEETPALRKQVFRVLRTACEAERVQAPPSPGDESLWSFFHRRDAEFWSERNRLVTPVIVFDQFEEIFTLGQETEAAQARSAAFLAELSDLVENRHPDSVRQALEADSAAAKRFDFKRSTVKLVLSFREDFLAEIEGLKDRMPSLMYNRFRLLAMSGAQAYDVIIRAGGTLVDDDIARRIVRLAWKNEPSPPVDPSDFPKIEIDPALLSVVCSELNHKRQQAEPPLARITPELLEGADREILSGFYERGMDGLDPRVRAFVEDKLITNDGRYRDSHVLENARALPGITSEALETLIRRRLLRVDERQSPSRLELTHDVLTRVVKDSRDSRRRREAEEAAKTREQAALRQQQRNRRNAALVLAGAFVVIVLIALTGWFAWEARLASHEAQAQRKRADEITKKSNEQKTNASKLYNQALAFAHFKSDEALRERERATALGRDAEGRKRKAGELLQEAEGTRMMANADRLQGSNYAASLLVNLEAIRVAPALDAQAGLLRRFVSHPQLSAFLPMQGQVHCVAFSPDRKRLAAGRGDGTVILWDEDSRKPLAKLEKHKAAVSGVVFSPNGKLLASGSEDGTVILWDVASRQSLTTLERHTKGEVRSVAFSPDGKRLASAHDDGTVMMWNVKRGKPMAPLGRHQARVNSVTFSPDGKRLASADEDGAVILWDVDSRKPLVTLEGHKKMIERITIKSDGQQLASQEEHTDAVESVAFSPDGLRLAFASGSTVILWGVDSHKQLASLEEHKGLVFGIAFSPDGKQLASASGDKTVILWDVDSHKPLASLEGHKEAVWGVTFSSDGKRLASASDDQTVIMWDMDSRKQVGLLAGHKETVSDVAFSPDGKQVASASVDDTVILWDVYSRKLLASLEGHKADVYGVAFSPDGKLLASAHEDGTVILWDVASRESLASLERHNAGVSSVAFSPNGKRLVSASWDWTVILWDVASHKFLATLTGHKNDVDRVALSPDGKLLASASLDKTVILWDVDRRKPLATLKGHKDAVLGVAFSPNGKRLATASLDKTVILWDVDNRKQLASLEGHESSVSSVAFSPDGKRLASAGDDKTVILWDVESRKPLATLEGHKDAVLGVAFSSDGKRLASASADKTVILWDLDLNYLKAEACRTANRNLTCGEWRSYIGVDKPYHKTCEGLPGPSEACE